MNFKKQLENQFKEINRNLTAENLMTENFIDANTDFKTWQEFKVKLNVSCCDEIEDMNESKRDSFIDKHTCFSNWKEMKEEAALIYVKKQFE